MSRSFLATSMLILHLGIVAIILVGSMLWLAVLHS